MQRFSSILAVFFERISPALLDEKGEQQLFRVTEHLPAGLAWSQFGFETRLDQKAANLDIALSITKDAPGLNILAGRVRTQNISAAMMEKCEWQRVTDFSNRWLNEIPDLETIPDVLFLEFDMPTSTPEQAIPLVFFGIDPQGGFYRSKLSIKNYTVLESCIVFFTGMGIANSMLENLRRCDLEAINHASNTLDHRCGVKQVGLMLSRYNEDVRFCVSGILPSKTYSYLRSIGWPGNQQQLAYVLKEIVLPFDYIILALDCSNSGLSPKLGLECYFYDNPKYEFDSRWKQVLDNLVKLNLCLSTKADAVLKFPSHERLISLSSSKEIDTALTDQPGYFTPISAIRGLHHLKVVLESDGKLSTKAYLWCSFS